MTLVTEQFESLFKSLLRMKNMRSLPYLVFPRGYDHFAEEVIKKTAHERLGEVVRALTTDVEGR